MAKRQRNRGDHRGGEPSGRSPKIFRGALLAGVAALQAAAGGGRPTAQAAVPDAASLAAPGPFVAGSQTVTVPRPNGSTFSALLFYPAGEGTAAPPATAAAPFPAIVFGHGFLQEPWRYDGTLAHLATHGHVVIAPGSATGLLPNHANFALDLRYALDYLARRDADPSDVFYGQVDAARAGLFGHSMGGGCGLLAAASDARFQAAAGLAAALTTPSPLPLMPDLRIPLALFSGDQDAIVPFETATAPLFEAARAPKQQVLLRGGSHVGFQDHPFPLFGDEGPLPVEEQTRLTRGRLTAFFGLHLREDQSLWRAVWGPEAAGDGVLSVAADPGVRLALSAPSAAAGRRHVHAVKLTNTGPEPNRFALAVEDHAWSTEWEPASSPWLAPGEEMEFLVRVEAPPGAAPQAFDAALVSARSLNDGASRGYLKITTTADVPEPGASGLALVGVAAACRRRRRAAAAPSGRGPSGRGPSGRGPSRRRPGRRHASRSRTTVPCTSVRRKSRPA